MLSYTVHCIVNIVDAFTDSQNSLRDGTRDKKLRSKALKIEDIPGEVSELC